MQLVGGHLVKVQKALSSLPDHCEPMVIEELDGFIVGLLLNPTEIFAVSNWIREVWSEDGRRLYPFGNLDDLNDFVDIIVQHYNSVAASLDGANFRYTPVFALDCSGFQHWQYWVEGFGRAVDLIPESWADLAKNDEENVRIAFAGLNLLRETPSGELSLSQDDKEFFESAATAAISGWVETLARASRFAYADNDERSNPSPRRLRRRGTIRSALAARFTPSCKSAQSVTEEHAPS